jgi:23S rRNA (uracil1939-C5)-methyltransferase
MSKISECTVAKKCGGCQYVGLPYKEQLKKKQKYIDELFKAFVKPDEIIGMENPYNYRNKVTATFARKKNGEIISGIYEEGTHRVLAVNECLIEDVRARAIIKTITRLISSFKLTVYNEDSGRGLIRHVMIRTGHKTGQIMVIIVTADSMFPSRNNFRKALISEHPEITTIIQNINSKHTSMVLGDRNQVIYGKGYIVDELCGKSFRISPGSFYQINSIQTEILYSKAIKYADIKKKETVIDAYCGIGTIGLAASDRAGKVIGVELNADAIRDARTNAAMNHVKNIEFYNADAGKFMVDMKKAGRKADVVIMDPPRSGSTIEFMSSVIQLAPRRIIYISCGPDTLARDLKYLTKHGYKVIKLTPVDMFPMTKYVETCVLLVKASDSEA